MEVRMEYRVLGRTGVYVSPLCLGTMNRGGPTPEAEAIRIVHKALDAGLNFIDTANVYVEGGSERVLAKALDGGKRNHVVLATKVYFPISDDPNDRGAARRHILMEVENSLSRLGTEWIDLYQMHRPVFELQQDETLRALDDLTRPGKGRYIAWPTYPPCRTRERVA